MDNNTAYRLVALNDDFYRTNAESFAQTRQTAWDGWDRACAGLEAPRSALDVACGNARFKAFLDERYGADAVDYHAVDSCEELLPQAARASFQRVDLLTPLLDGKGLSGVVSAPACQLVTCFGFMHHVPTGRARRDLFHFLVGKALPGGRVVVSFWQFANDARMVHKAQATTEAGCAELGLQLQGSDFLLGWNGLPGAYRYCHSFSDAEVDALALAVSDAAHVIDRFKADGKNGQSNAYLVLRRL